MLNCFFVLWTQISFINSTTWVNSSTSPSLSSLPPWDLPIFPCFLCSLTSGELPLTRSSPSASSRSIWLKVATSKWFGEMRSSVHATGALITSSSASEMMVGAGTRTRADLALRRVFSSFSLNYERETERWIQVDSSAGAHNHTQYLASLLHESHLFLALFSAGKALFSGGLQGLQSCWRSLSDRLSVI